jgi:ComF family protein
MLREITWSLQAVAHLFYPQLCAGCGNDLHSKGQVICLRCLDEVPVTNFHLHAANPVEKIFWGRVAVTTATSYTYFTKDSMMQLLLHGLKYQGKKETGIFFGRKIGSALLQCNRFIDIDAIIPVPLHPKKEKARGYNQATMIAEGISEKMQLPLWGSALYRTGASETQTHKTRVERWNNIAGLFSVKNGKQLEGKHVLLVDDVITTGATLEACAAALLKVKDTRVSIATLAYASV